MQPIDNLVWDKDLCASGFWYNCEAIAFDAASCALQDKLQKKGFDTQLRCCNYNNMVYYTPSHEGFHPNMLVEPAEPTISIITDDTARKDSFAVRRPNYW